MARRSNRRAKDSVFVDLFNDRKYCLQLYQALHPDTDATERDIKTITLKHVVVDKQYNDLGILVKDRMIVLVEAQSTWSYNVLLRILLYIADTYITQIRKNPRWDIHDTATLPLPTPEFVVVYTGRRKVPERVSLRRDFFRDETVPLDLEARVISAEGDDIIGQYIVFSHVFDDMVRRYGLDRQAAEETIRVCRDRGVLAEYLREREEEVMEAMVILFDQKTAVEQYGDRRAAIARDEERKRLWNETRAEVRENKRRDVQRMHNTGASDEYIASCLDLELAQVKAWIAELPKS